MKSETVFVKRRWITPGIFLLVAILALIFVPWAAWDIDPYAPNYQRFVLALIAFVVCFLGSIAAFNALFTKNTKVHEQLKNKKTKRATKRPMKHYAIEDNAPVDLKKMKQDGLMPENEYRSANANLILACHDVFIKYADGILLVKRRTKPAINTWWPLGGRILKGFSNEESLSKRIKSECGLELTNIQ